MQGGSKDEDRRHYTGWTILHKHKVFIIVWAKL